MRQLRIGVPLVALLLAVLGPATPARAHAHFVESTPGAGAVLATTPPRMQLFFDEELSDADSWVRVTGPLGQRADRNDLQVDGVKMWISLLDQGPGAYRVRWKAVADDEQGVTHGDFVFSIQSPLPPNAPQISVSPTVADNGQPVTVAGSGFTPNGTLVLTVGDGDDLLTSTRADTSGRFAVQVTLPGELPFGRQVVQVTDASNHLATASIWVPNGGGPVAVVRMLGEASEDEPGQVEYTIRVENHSGYHLRGTTLRADIPAGARVLADGLGRPESLGAGVVQNGQVVWRLGAMPPHSIVGPFTFSVVVPVAGTSTRVASRATLGFGHVASPPLFRGSTRSSDAAVRVAAP